MAIEFDDADRKIALKGLAETCDRSEWACQAWHLAINHNHLLFDIRDWMFANAMNPSNSGINTWPRIFASRRSSH